jgi:acyl-CoA reductase-like NAD-dependent aldehyde dehydrogenase
MSRKVVGCACRGLLHADAPRHRPRPHLSQPAPRRRADPRVAKIAFTGSTATGKRVNQAAASNLRPATMELGGKSALIVFDDADVDKAVEWAMFGSFWTNGQICSATSRLLLQRGIAPRFLAALKQRAESIRVGDPLQPGCRLGPLVCEAQHRKVMGYVQVSGGRLIRAGKAKLRNICRCSSRYQADWQHWA